MRALSGFASQAGFYGLATSKTRITRAKTGLAQSVPAPATTNDGDSSSGEAQTMVIHLVGKTVTGATMMGLL